MSLAKRKVNSYEKNNYIDDKDYYHCIPKTPVENNSEPQISLKINYLNSMMHMLYSYNWKPATLQNSRNFFAAPSDQVYLCSVSVRKWERQAPGTPN